MYFQVSSNSPYPQYSGERYMTIGLLVLELALVNGYNDHF